MQIANSLSRYQLVPLVFAQDAVAASQTSVALFCQQVHGAVALDNVGYCMPFGGYVVGVSANLTAAATAGTLGVVPTIGGSAVTDPAIQITTETNLSDVCPRATNVFAANQAIGCEITTNAAWDGTAQDLVVIVWVLQKLAGI